MQPIYLLVGVPASGKSWVCERVSPRYNYISHDSFIGNPGSYLEAIVEDATNGSRPVLIETPFSMSKFTEPLLDRGFVVNPVFVLADEVVLQWRWNLRGTLASVRKGHLNRQLTYQNRAAETGSFCGNSDEVLAYLNSIID